MTNKIDQLFKIADTIKDDDLRNKYLEILRDSMSEKMWLDKYHLTMFVWWQTVRVLHLGLKICR